MSVKNKFTVARVFSDHCVLQREKPICVFGTASDEEEVRAALFLDGKKCISENLAVAKEGRWQLYLPPVKAQENASLTVSTKNESITFKDISVGEVWLAGGQSNMEFELGNCTEGTAEFEKEKSPRVRFYYTQKIAWMDEAFFEAEDKTSWETWESRTRNAWSAVGYFFAKRLAKKLGVTVGIIGCNWGGTSASAWMSKERLERDSELSSYLTDYQKACSGKTKEEQCAEFDAYQTYHTEWQKKCDALYRENPKIEWAEVERILGKCQWPGPMNCKNPYRPTGLYECMISRILPYTLKGFIYYQGESDDHKPTLYYRLFRELIDQWRSDWHDDSLPFLFVQLPEHRYRQDRDFKNWPLIREAQEKVFKTVKNTGMVVALGLGEYDDIHPKHKKVLAERLALTALEVAYKIPQGKKTAYPIFSKAISKANSMILYFANADWGLIFTKDEMRLEHYRDMQKRQNLSVPQNFTGFELAGSDKVFYAAECTVEKNRITLTAKEVPQPKYARYGWYNYGPVTVFSKAGLPLSPFRTSVHDEEKTQTEHAAIQQIMET